MLKQGDTVDQLTLIGNPATLQQNNVNVQPIRYQLPIHLQLH